MALLSREFNFLIAYASLILTLMYATIAIGFTVFGNAATRAFAIGACVPLFFLCATLALAFAIVSLDETAASFNEQNFRWVVGICWMLVVICGAALVIVRSFVFSK